MSAKILLILSFLIFSFHSSSSCDSYRPHIEYLNSLDFAQLMKQKFPLNSIQWINLQDIHSETPEGHIWVNEGDGGYMTSPLHPKKGIATTGLLTCTALTAFSQKKYPALAHISDWTSPPQVLAYLQQMEVDLKRPITLISRTFNTNHLLSVKAYIEDKLNISPVIKTLPIFVDKNQTKTCLNQRAFEALMKDSRGISIAMNAKGEHYFFYQSLDEQKRIQKDLDPYRQGLGYSNLYITQLPYPKIH